MPDVLRIQRPRLVHVARPFDDRPTIGKDSELVAVGRELQQETVVAHVAELAEVAGQLLEIEARRGAMGDLDGVAAAEAGRLRALLAVEPLEPAVFAARTINLAQQRGDLDAALDVVPNIHVDQVSANLLLVPGEDLERLGRLEAGDDIDDG